MNEQLICNICGKPLDVYDANQRFVLHTKVGYGSRYDGETVSLHLCCECFDNLVDNCTISPVCDE